MMDITWAQKLTKEELQSKFGKYLHSKGITWVSINTYKSDAFYIYRFDRELFWNTFGSDDYANAIQGAFDKVLQIRGLHHQSGTDIGYRRAFDMFREFLEMNSPKMHEQHLSVRIETKNEKVEEKKKRPDAWDIYEAALLLDLYLRVTNREVVKKRGVEELSHSLRQRATGNGKIVNEIYRNKVGISSQLEKMRFYFTHRERNTWYRVGYVSEIFGKIIDMYRSDRLSYDAILKQAKEQIRETQVCILQDDVKKVKDKSADDCSVKCIVDNEGLSRYASLCSYLKGCGKDRIDLTFMMLEEIFNNHLSPSAYTNSAWWANGGTQQSEAWLKAGYKVLECSLYGRRFVSFIKITGNQQHVSSDKAGKGTENSISNDSISKELRDILVDKFPNGFRFGSVDKKKFCDIYKERNNVDFIFEDVFMRQALAKVAIDCGAKWYLPEQLVDENLAAKIDEFVAITFAEKRKYLYYSFLHKYFEKDFLGTTVGDIEIFKQYLRQRYMGKYYFSRDYFTCDWQKVDERDEIREFLEGKGMPLSSDEIIDGLCHIPADRIKQILGMNSEFVSNALNTWFAVGIVSFDIEDIEKLCRIIENCIRDKSYITKNDLYKKVGESLPFFLQNNSFLTSLGLRNTLRHILQGKFNFNGAIICSKDEKLTSMDVLTEFAKSRREFSNRDLQDLANDLAVTFVDAYYDRLYQISVRVSKDRFVRKDLISFNSEEIDAAISRLMKRNYLPLKDFEPFIGFPYCGYSWNKYLLESYMANYSKDYFLLHASFGQERVAGVVVRKHSGINDFIGLVVRALADSNVSLVETQALNWLVDNGYILRRNFKNFDAVLRRAETLREENS